MFCVSIPASIQRHNVLETTKLRGDRPSRNGDIRQVLASEMAPKSVSAHRPLVLQVKCELVDIHVNSFCLDLNETLSTGKVDGIGHTLQRNVVGLQEPSCIKDEAQAVAAMIVHATHISLSRKALAGGKPPVTCKWSVPLSAWSCVKGGGGTQFSLNDWAGKVRSKRITCQG